jgi:hypothetical protein
MQLYLHSPIHFTAAQQQLYHNFTTSCRCVIRFTLLLAPISKDQSSLGPSIGVEVARVRFPARYRILCSSILQAVARRDKDGSTGDVALQRKVCEQSRRIYQKPKWTVFKYCGNLASISSVYASDLSEKKSTITESHGLCVCPLLVSII